ncbi:membrane protein FAM174A isoform X2 [Pongo abelii]|uniref:Transmembrane protein 157 n=1 Tax=Pongo abelii TaxID=9601 RepID=A0A8I5U2V0_PONAB
MKALQCCCCLSHLLASVLLLLLLPELSGPLAVLLQAAEAAPGPGPPDPRPRTLPPLPPGPTLAQQPGRGLAEAAGPRGSEGGNGSSPVAGLEADDHGGKAGEGSVGGGLAVSPNPGDKPMTQRALTVLMVVSGAVLVYFVVRTVRRRKVLPYYQCFLVLPFNLPPKWQRITFLKS